MSHERVTEELLAGDGLLDDDLQSDDYCFIFDGEGNIKAVIIPEVLPFKPPKNIAKILKVLGIRDISMLDIDHSLH